MNIHKIIKSESIYIEYQPIMSTHHSEFLGLEALTRSRDGKSIISPIALFFEAEIEGVAGKLDLLCIRKAIEGFSSLYQEFPRLVLFINISANVIDQYLVEPILLELANRYAVPPENIVLEINELHNDSIHLMQEFTQKHREQGFLIAVDDIGAGSSNLDRIPLIKPNVMKIDKELVKNIHTSFYKEQVVTTVMQLATNIAASVVIEGIETLDDLIKVSTQGAQLIQGYLLSKPKAMNSDDILELKAKIKQLLSSLYTATQEEKMIQLAQNMEMQRICDNLVHHLKSCSSEYYESIMEEFLPDELAIESAYLLNTQGTLITNTILNKHVTPHHINSLYSPCKKGNSVQLESYYTQLIYGGYDFWISPEYLSMATGNKSCTLSRRFTNIDSEDLIICIDFYKKMIHAPIQNKNITLSSLL